MDQLLLKIFVGVTSGTCTIALIVAMVGLVKQSGLKQQLLNQRSKHKKLGQKHTQTVKDIKELQEAQTQLSQISDLAQSLSEHSEKFDTVNQQLELLSEKLEEYDKRLSTIESRDSQTASYQHAAKLVELGAGQDDIAQTCGLSRAEADLVALVNRAQTQKTKQSDEPQTTDQPPESEAL